MGEQSQKIGIKVMAIDLFNQAVWSDNDFVVMASYFGMFPQYTVYDKRTMTA